MPDRPVVLFDGACELCNRAVQFIIRRDPGAHFRFTPLQSDAGRRLLEAHGLPGEDPPETIVLIERGAACTRSEAALRIARRLRRPWPWLAAAARLAPRALRDALYRLVAARRGRWFGRRDAGSRPRGAPAERFLD